MGAGAAVLEELIAPARRMVNIRRIFGGIVLWMYYVLSLCPRMSLRWQQKVKME
jgi:hypothetical protein